MRVTWPYFMVWTRYAQHAIRVQLAAMRCKRLGHKQIVGLWNDKEQKHNSFCVACEMYLPGVEVPEAFKEHRVTHE